jgi:hypothetical protein
MLDAGLMPKLLLCMDTTDSETQYWCVSLVHEILNIRISFDLAESIIQFYEHDGLDVVLVVARQKNHQAHFYIAEVISKLCANDQIDDNPYLKNLVGTGLIDVVFGFCSDEEEELRYSGVALMLNFVNVSMELSKEIIDSGGIVVLSRYLLPGTQSASQTVAARTLVSLAHKDPSIRFEILIFCVRTCFLRFAKTANEYLANLAPTFTDTEKFDLPKSLSLVSELKTQLDCLSLFAETNVFSDVSDGQSLEEYLSDLMPDTSRIVSAILYNLADLHSGSSKYIVDEHEELLELLHALSITALCLSRNLLKFGT